MIRGRETEVGRNSRGQKCQERIWKREGKTIAPEAILQTELQICLGLANASSDKCPVSFGNSW